MRKSIFIFLLCCFMAACTNEKAKRAADDAVNIPTDTVLTVETRDELPKQVQDTDTMAKSLYDVCTGSYRVTKIETFLVPNEDEKVRYCIDVNLKDSIDIPGVDAIAVITRNQPLSVDTIRIRRSDLDTAMHAYDLPRLMIHWISLKEIKNDTVVFSVSIVKPDTDDGYIMNCYRYGNKTTYEIDDVAWPYEEDEEWIPMNDSVKTLSTSPSHGEAKP